MTDADRQQGAPRIRRPSAIRLGPMPRTAVPGIRPLGSAHPSAVPGTTGVAPVPVREHLPLRAAEHSPKETIVNTIHLSLSAHPPQPGVLSALPARTPRTSPADRLAMWLGLRLLLWSTRPIDRAEVQRRHERRRIAAAARAEHDAVLSRTEARYGVHWTNIR